MTDPPVMNLFCLKNPTGRCVLVVESCVNCRNRKVLLAHAAAHQKEAVEFGEQVLNTSDTAFEAIQKLRKKRDNAFAARDAVLELAGMKDLEASK